MLRRLLKYLYTMLVSVKTYLSAPPDIAPKWRNAIELQFSEVLNLQNNTGIKPEQQVHELRKAVKRIRALLRASKLLFLPKVYEDLDELLAEAARELTFHRESVVNRDTFTRLCKKLGEECPDELMKKVHGVLLIEIHNLYTENKKSTGRKLDESFQLLQQAAFGIHSCSMQSMSQKYMDNQLQKSYLKALRLFNDAYHTLDPEVIHSWRKVVKNLLFQLKFSPHSFALSQQTLDLYDRLTDTLGNEHDLFVLEEYIVKNAELSQAELSQVHKWIFRERNQLQREAFAQGRIIFEEPSLV